MSKRANPTVVGSFVLGAVLLTVGAVLVFGGGALFRERQKAVLFFTSSVKGLGIGAPVVYEGVKIGQVSEIVMEVDLVALHTRIPVVVELDLDQVRVMRGSRRNPRADLQRWVQRGLRGQLGLQSFVTNQLMVTLDLRPETPMRLAGGYKGLPEIPTIPTPLEVISNTLADLPIRDMVTSLSSALEGVSKTVNSPAVANSLASAERSFRGADELVADLRRELRPLLANANRAVGDVRKVVSSLGGSAQAALDDAHGLVLRVEERVGPLAERLDGTLSQTHALLQRVDGHVDPLLTTLEETAKDAGRLVRNTDENLAPVLQKVGEASAAAAVALEQAAVTMASLQREQPLGRNLNAALRDFSAASRSLRVLSDYLEQRPDAVLRGRVQMGGP